MLSFVPGPVKLMFFNSFKSKNKCSKNFITKVESTFSSVTKDFQTVKSSQGKIKRDLSHLKNTLKVDQEVENSLRKGSD